MRTAPQHGSVVCWAKSIVNAPSFLAHWQHLSGCPLGASSFLAFPAPPSDPGLDLTLPQHPLRLTFCWFCSSTPSALRLCAFPRPLLALFPQRVYWQERPQTSLRRCRQGRPWKPWVDREREAPEPRNRIAHRACRAAGGAEAAMGTGRPARPRPFHKAAGHRRDRAPCL